MMALRALARPRGLPFLDLGFAGELAEYIDADIGALATWRRAQTSAESAVAY